MRLWTGTLLSAAVMCVVFASSCVEKPKVDRAAVSKPTETPRAASGADTEKPPTVPTERATSAPEEEETPRPKSSPRPDFSATPESEMVMSPGLPSGEQEIEAKAKACEQGGRATLCVQIGYSHLKKQKYDLARKFFTMGCLGKADVNWKSAVCTFEPDPNVSDAKSCYLVAYASKNMNDTPTQSAALQCACSKKYRPACPK
jgi:hypothetical protein